MVNGEAGEVSGEIVNALMEGLWELTKDDDPVDIWNMEETGCFFKALPMKGLAEKKSQARGGVSSVLQERKLLKQLLFGEALN